MRCVNQLSQRDVSLKEMWNICVVVEDHMCAVVAGFYCIVILNIFHQNGDDCKPADPSNSIYVISSQV